MVREGPCRVPGCPDPDNSSGQWQLIPEAKCLELTLNFGTDCSCKKASCLRNVGLKEPKKTPGRKRPAGGDVVPTGVPLRADALPLASSDTRSYNDTHWYQIF